MKLKSQKMEKRASTLFVESWRAWGKALLDKNGHVLSQEQQYLQAGVGSHAVEMKRCAFFSPLAHLPGG